MMTRDMFDHAARSSREAMVRHAHLAYRDERERSRFIQGADWVLAEMFKYAPPPRNHGSA